MSRRNRPMRTYAQVTRDMQREAARSAERICNRCGLAMPARDLPAHAMERHAGEAAAEIRDLGR